MPKEKEFRVDIDLGREETTIYEYAIIGVILDILKALMIRFGVSPRNAMRVIDNINRGNGRGRSLTNLLSLLGVYANAEKCYSHTHHR